MRHITQTNARMDASDAIRSNGLLPIKRGLTFITGVIGVGKQTVQNKFRSYVCTYFSTTELYLSVKHCLTCIFQLHFPPVLSLLACEFTV